jgi:hypothetical protein
MFPFSETVKFRIMQNKNKENSNESKIPGNDQPSFFEIRVKGHLDKSWSDWLEGLGVRLLDNGEMVLSGHIVDQAALMGILNKLYSLNLTILSVYEVD